MKYSPQFIVFCISFLCQGVHAQAVVRSACQGVHVPASPSNEYRYGLFVYHKIGWKGQSKLLHVEKDAHRLCSVLKVKGGFHGLIVANPTGPELFALLKQTKRRLESLQKKGRRIHFLFYYSGHASQYAFHLGPRKRDALPLRKFARLIKSMRFEVNITIVDACNAVSLLQLIGN